MASLSQYLLLLCSFTCLIHSSRSRTLVLPLAKDASTLQYVATVYHGPSLDPVELAVDLGGPSLWLDCSASSSASVRRVPCRSIACLAATSDVSGLRRACAGGACSDCDVQSESGAAGEAACGVLAEGAVAVDAVDGSGERSVAAVDRFLISCARAAPGFGAGGVRGTLGLGRSRISLPSQMATAFGIRRRFFACLSASEGVIVAGDGPFFSHLNADISKSLTYTPLATAKSTRSSDYLINLTSIKINGKRLSLNSSSPRSVKLSTAIPYAAMVSPIYSVFAEAFAGAASAMGMARVPPVGPFRVCFDPRSVSATGVGPDAPAIDLVLQSEMVRWRIGGSSSMVRMSDEATCLGVVDGGNGLESSVVLGGHQLEDVLLEFDFGGSRLGFGPPSAGQLGCSDLRPGFNSMAFPSL
ncbi:probable aspartic proteinase GIP2 [Rhodamnia argentea]|uniref:Probable aspartic proteinase GIP2 n=1 Tax=Rhodamnia argentea TaxID=178133 RepID=A0A8B8MZS9_9MYRT|nr:probable aspartic proteinase GIP2 [Rhodamnia argentea]